MFLGSIRVLVRRLPERRRRTRLPAGRRKLHARSRETRALPRGQRTPSLSGCKWRDSLTALAFQLLATPAPGCIASPNHRMIQLDPVLRAVPGLVPTLMNEPIDRRIAPVSANCFQRNPANGTHHPKQLANAGIIQTPGGKARVQVCLPKDLVGHPIPDARKKFLNQEQPLQRSASAAL